jgi:hypothetical protein
MVPGKYLRGLDASDDDIPGFFGVRHSRKPGAWRFICSYTDGKRLKAQIFRKMAASGQHEQPKTWEWHHVVEGQHYADVDVSGRLSALYLDNLPCVLISKEEHLAYNRILHIKETDELFRDFGLPKELTQRSWAAKALAADRRTHGRLRQRIIDLRQAYRHTYEGDLVLSTIAENVFDDVLAELR